MLGIAAIWEPKSGMELCLALPKRKVLRVNLARELRKREGK
jgi:hypothetical protein